MSMIDVYMCILILIYTDYLLNVNAEEIVSSYIYSGQLTWKEAKQKCSMVGLNHRVNTTSSRLSSPVTAWIDASASYTPWAEYKGCFTFNDTSVLEIRQVPTTNPFLWCSEKCHQFTYFGLQASTCACLKANTIDTSFLKRLCRSKPCQKDENVLCSEETSGFVLYKTSLSNQFMGIGNCITVQMTSNRKIYQPRNCSHQYRHICRTSFNHNTIQKYTDAITTWIQGIDQKGCTSLASYEMVSSITLDVGEFWIGEIRRYKESYPPIPDPKYCIAAEVYPDGHVVRSVRNCTDQLPILCARMSFTGNTHENNSRHLSFQDKIVASLSVILIVAVVVLVGLCVRFKRNQRRSENQTAPITNQHEIVYAQVNKPGPNSGALDENGGNNQTTYDVYDHMDHTCRPRDIGESNYDTMQNIENIEKNEDVYDCAKEAQERRFIVDNDAEYSHIEIEDDT